MKSDFWTLVDQVALDVIHEHVLSSPDAEVGGFLIGTSDDPAVPLRCRSAIASHEARGDLTRLTFTHDAWEHVHRVVDEQYPEEDIVGWYHSHPGHGVFLSGHDRFIHGHFFPASWQIAIVVDPVNGTEGFFGWVNGELILLDERPIGHAGMAAAYRGSTAFTQRPGARPRRTERLVVTLDAPEPVPEPALVASPFAATARQRPASSLDAPAPRPVPPAPQPKRRPTLRYPLRGHVLPIGAGLLIGLVAGLVAFA